MTSPKEAKETVLAIADEFGYFADYDQVMESMGQWNSDVRKKVEKSFFAKDTIGAQSIKTLAKNLYGSDARFIFELLQNADDNIFNWARHLGEQPRIAFHVHPRRIVVECNEDGFTKENLRAICSVGKSTKSGSHGYIGAKGIGFKSVFIAAWKVSIQSGDFSFYFKHKKNDPGMGMVIPMWQDSTDRLPDPMTRMTLHLHEEGDPEELARLRDTIFRQLNELQQTSLLFLRNIRQIAVVFYDEDEQVTTSRTFRVGPEKDRKVVIETTSVNGSKTSVDKKLYHRTSYIAENVTKSENRGVPAKGASSYSEVVLVFPLTIELEPVIESQELFAFLPIRESSFKFLIQADFDTTASRQDIVTTSLRNENLRDAIADAFIKAILQFCEHPLLSFTWPSFLPSLKEEHGVFWSRLTQRIKDLVQRTPLLKSRHKRHLRLISDVFEFPPSLGDSDGESLFDDSADDPFISSAYPKTSVDALSQYGLQRCNYTVVFRLLKADLRSPSSRMRSPSTSQKWHSAIARLLTRCLGKAGHMAELKKKSILPLRDGTWVAANNSPAYLPSTDRIPIPPGIGLEVLDPVAVANSDRRTLFTKLVSTEPQVSLVRDRVIRSLAVSYRSPVDVEISRAQLHYLYRTRRHLIPHPEDDFAKIALRLESGATARPQQQDVYLPTENHSYGPRALLDAKDASSPDQFQVDFLHADYLQDCPDGDLSAWKTWLHYAIGIRIRLRLVSREGDALSDTASFVLKYRPEKFLDMLEHLWKYEEQLYKSNPALLTKMKRIKASHLCHPAVAKGFGHRLETTYLPLPALQQQCKDFMGDDWIYFPFLKVEKPPQDTSLFTKWMFLHKEFGVRINDDARFLCDILEVLAYPSSELTADAQKRIFKLYETMDARVRAFGARETDVGNAFKKRFWSCEIYDLCILIPAQTDGEAFWVETGECYWDAPVDMESSHSLKHLYSQAVSERQMTLLSRFFSQTLEIPSASWEDVVEELRTLKRQKCDDLHQIRGNYAYLAKLDTASFQEDLRKKFEKNGLVFAGKQGAAGWHKTSACLWCSTTDIRGKVTLSDDYEDLKEFFVDVLGVQTPTPQMVYDELLQTQPNAPIEDVKSALRSLNALLQTENDRPDPKPLAKKPIFPVRDPNGQTALRTAETDFALNDNDLLAGKFQGQIHFLDFSREEILRLKPLLQWFGLTDRYLSYAVRESTSVVVDDSTRPITYLSHDIKRKAHAILRIGAHFDSPRYRAGANDLYKLLQGASTFETTGIYSVLSISQNGHDFELEAGSGDTHIAENESDLVFYVSLGGDKQEICFLDNMPHALANWLMQDSTTPIHGRVEQQMVTTLVKVMSASTAVVHLVLERLGIINVPIANIDISGPGEVDPSVDPEEEASLSVRTPTRTRAASELFSDTDDGVQYTPSSGQSSSSPDHDIIDLTRSVSESSHSASERVTQPLFTSLSVVHPRSPVASEEDAQYLRLLDRVVNAARQATFPSARSAFDMSSLLDALPEDSSDDDSDEPEVRDGCWGSHFLSQLERNRKIAAAGELYAFELLSRLGAMPDWSRENWQSPNRRHVVVHPDYEDMTPWTGPETADMTYQDEKGIFTSWLLENGYLDERWRGARPKYYLDVRIATTGRHDAPFYLSRSQCQWMQDLSNAPGREENYMILHVFGIEKGQIGMSVYVDLERWRADGKLKFTEEGWSVVPCSSL